MQMQYFVGLGFFGAIVCKHNLMSTLIILELTLDENIILAK